MATIMGIVARRKGLQIEGLRIHVTKVMSSSPPRRIAKLETHVYMPLPPDHPDREALERGAVTPAALLVDALARVDPRLRPLPTVTPS